MRMEAAATGVNTGPTEERGAPGPAGTAAGAGRRRYHSVIAASPNAELRYCRTWQTVPMYQPKLTGALRSEEHTSELQSQSNLVCRLLLEKKKKNSKRSVPSHILAPGVNVDASS